MPHDRIVWAELPDEASCGQHCLWARGRVRKRCTQIKAKTSRSCLLLFLLICHYFAEAGMATAGGCDRLSRCCRGGGECRTVSKEECVAELMRASCGIETPSRRASRWRTSECKAWNCCAIGQGKVWFAGCGGCAESEPSLFMHGPRVTPPVIPATKITRLHFPQLHAAI